MASVGKRVARPDSLDKVTGSARYIDDLSFGGMLFAAVVRSPHAHARVRKLSLSNARRMEGVHAVLTARDIRGANLIPLIQQDQPMLADDEVRHIGEAVVLIAAETRQQAEDAARAVQVDYEVLPATLSIEEGFKNGEIIQHWKIRRGSPQDIFSRSDVAIVEGTYHTPYQEHAYIETNGMIAVPETDGGITVYGSLQCPFYVQKAVASITGLMMNACRVIQTVTGGGFGGKEDAPSLPAAMVASLAQATGRPVKYIMPREEDMQVMSKRHPGKILSRMAASRDGKLLAIDVDYFLDSGAYATLSPVVLWRGINHAAGPYRCEHARVDAYAIRTHKIPCGAFRGFGEPQIVFAQECQIDRLAEKLHIDPLNFREMNALELGDVTLTGQRLKESVGFKETIAEVKRASRYEELRREIERENAVSASNGRAGVGQRKRRGLGLGCCYYGVGLGARGGYLNAAGASVVVSADASVTVAVGTTEIGQGMITVLSQIAADAIGCPFEFIRILPPDTALVPDSGPTVASRTTLMSGNAIADACRQIRERIIAACADFDFSKAAEDHFHSSSPEHTTPKGSAKSAFKDIVTGSYRAGEENRSSFDENTRAAQVWKATIRHCFQNMVQLSAHGWAVPPQTTYDTETGMGDVYVTYSHTTNLAEVEVDLETGEARVLRVWTAHDVGKAINPQTGEGQIEGGVIQGLGYALTEEHILATRDSLPDARFRRADGSKGCNPGRILNDQFSTYIIPTAMDTPAIHPILVEQSFSYGPYGAKGLGETPIIAVAPAIVNAIAHATGIHLMQIPATPERIWEALRVRDKSTGSGKSEVRSQKSGSKSQRSEVRRRKSESRSQ
ncbi:MAG: xanthine dehydrogenase family protein molybdopterin-binding subunit [Acidobacteriia bacterium]|nr:xanthine dehydrogenase family protein molybdopterin-binding subunit [Terriglobia bacterium]